MSIESINPNSNETLANRAKGIARQVLNLVNQALFDGAKENAAFSAILDSQQATDTKVDANKVQPKAIETENDPDSSNIEIHLEKSESSEVQSVTNNSKNNDNPEIVLDVQDKTTTEESQELTEESVPVEQEVISQDSSNVAQIVETNAQSEIVAAAAAGQSGNKIEQAVVQSLTENSETEVVNTSSQLPPESADTPEKSEIPAEIAEKIKQFTPQDQKHANATKNDDNVGQNVKELVHARNDARQLEKSDLGSDIANAVKVENFSHNKVSDDKAALAANLQQFIAKSSARDVLLSNTVLVEQLKNINPENISSLKTASTAIKIASDNSALVGSKPGAIGAATANSQMAAFNNAGSQDMGQKLENSKNSKPLTKSQLVSTMEKVEAVLKKIADSKDGSTISLRLDPPQLGTVRADVSLKDGVLHARLTAENAQVLQLLRDRASDLQVTLRKMGLDVEKVSISVNSSDLGTFSGDAEDRQGKNGTRQGSFFSAQADFAELTDSNILDHWIA